MAINRIKENLLLIKKHDVIAIADYNEEFFCDKNITVANLEYTLWNNLKHDYKRIIFFENSEKIYFFDKKSLNSCYGDMPNLKHGPLGNLDILEESDKIISKSIPNKYLSSKKQNNISLSLNKYSLKNEIMLKKSYEIIINSLEHFISENIESLFIFRNPSEFLFKNINTEMNINGKGIKYSKGTAIKILKKILNTRNNKNKIIFVFSEKEEIIREKFNRYIFKDNELLEKLINFSQINNPETEEITDLVNHLRLLNSLQVDWNNFNQDIHKISRQNLSLKEIYLKLNKISHISNLNFDEQLTDNISQSSAKKNNLYDSIDWIEL